MEFLGIVLAFFVLLLILGIVGVVFRVLFAPVKVLLREGFRVLLLLILLLFVLTVLGVV